MGEGTADVTKRIEMTIAESTSFFATVSLPLNAALNVVQSGF
jgi:hypothetical protein